MVRQAPGGVGRDHVRAIFVDSACRNVCEYLPSYKIMEFLEISTR